MSRVGVLVISQMWSYINLPVLCRPDRSVRGPVSAVWGAGPNLTPLRPSACVSFQIDPSRSGPRSVIHHDIGNEELEIGKNNVWNWLGVVVQARPSGKGTVEYPNRCISRRHREPYARLDNHLILDPVPLLMQKHTFARPDRRAKMKNHGPICLDVPRSHVVG